MIFKWFARRKIEAERAEFFKSACKQLNQELENAKEETKHWKDNYFLVLQNIESMKERFASSLANEQYVSTLHLQVESLSRANKTLQKQLSDKIWTDLHKAALQELETTQRDYWKVVAELAEIKSKE